MELGRRGLGRRDDEQRVRSASASLGASCSPRNVSAIAAALASMPMIGMFGARTAAATTARPSPVPTSIWTRRWRAMRSAS